MTLVDAASPCRSHERPGLGPAPRRDVRVRNDGLVRIQQETAQLTPVDTAVAREGDTYPIGATGCINQDVGGRESGPAGNRGTDGGPE